MREEDAPGRIFRTKAIRVLSLAPSLDNSDSKIVDEEVDAKEAQRPQNVLQALWMMFNDDDDEDEDEDEDEEGEDMWDVVQGYPFEDY